MSCQMDEYRRCPCPDCKVVSEKIDEVIKASLTATAEAFSAAEAWIAKGSIPLETKNRLAGQLVRSTACNDHIVEVLRKLDKLRLA